MRAAISARSCERMRAVRSASRSAASRQAQGASTSTSAIATALDLKAASRPDSVAFRSTKTITAIAISERPATRGTPVRPRARTIPAPHRTAGQIKESEKPKPRSAIAPATASATKPSSRRRMEGGGPSSGAIASQAPA